jgi:hypothetical protein
MTRAATRSLDPVPQFQPSLAIAMFVFFAVIRPAAHVHLRSHQQVWNMDRLLGVIQPAPLRMDQLSIDPHGEFAPFAMLRAAPRASLGVQTPCEVVHRASLIMLRYTPQQGRSSGSGSAPLTWAFAPSAQFCACIPACRVATSPLRSAMFRGGPSSETRKLLLWLDRLILAGRLQTCRENFGRVRPVFGEIPNWLLMHTAML